MKYLKVILLIICIGITTSLISQTNRLKHFEVGYLNYSYDSIGGSGVEVENSKILTPGWHIGFKLGKYLIDTNYFFTGGAGIELIRWQRDVWVRNWGGSPSGGWVYQYNDTARINGLETVFFINTSFGRNVKLGRKLNLQLQISPEFVFLTRVRTIVDDPPPSNFYDQRKVRYPNPFVLRLAGIANIDFELSDEKFVFVSAEYVRNALFNAEDVYDKILRLQLGIKYEF